MPILKECTFSATFDLSNAFHGLDSGLNKITVVTNRNVSSFFKVNRGVLD